MKHYLVFILLFISLSLCAQNVTPEEAESVAYSFFNNTLSKSSSSLLRRVELPQTKSISNLPSYYIYNRTDQKGFVIVSGNTMMQPILAYSNSSLFEVENLPPSLKEWLSQVEAVSVDLQTVNDDTLDEHPMWRSIKSSGPAATYTPVVYYETAEWNQGEPYNEYCPSINGKKSWAGCTATALAILMRYYTHPSRGYGYTNEYSYTDETGASVTINPVPLSEYFDWDNMPLSYSKAWTRQNEEAVFNLIYKCALMCNVSFGTDESTGSLYSGHKHLQENMNYDKSSLFYVRNWYSDYEWQRMICENLEEIGPLLYSASSKYSGHAFVIDGYDSNYLFHINWGWGGYQNGYFAMPGLLSYKYNHRAAFGVQPNKFKDPVQYLSLSNLYGCSGITLSDESPILEGKPFYISCGFLKNESVSSSFNGYIAAATIDINKNLKEYISEENRIKLNAGYGYKSYNIECVITKDIDVGDKITLFYKNDNDGIWRQVFFDRYTITGEYPIYDQEYIDESTSIDYLPEKHELTIRLKEGVKYSLEMNNITYLCGISVDGDPIKIDTALLPNGRYILKLVKRKENETIILNIKGN